jgi:aromatic ring hydroxylase
MLPSCVLDFANPELAAIINKTQRSATMQSEQKVKFLKAAWDAIAQSSVHAIPSMRCFRCRRAIRHLRPEFPHYIVAGLAAEISYPRLR